MGRQPCCEKVGLKRGPWTIEEDQKLVNFILKNGIQCWRVVPKLAGSHPSLSFPCSKSRNFQLISSSDSVNVVDNSYMVFFVNSVNEGLLRCGKSCRLRWINYLRPDLKRGAITEDEEDQIIELHSHLGNRSPAMIVIPRMLFCSSKNLYDHSGSLFT